MHNGGDMLDILVPIGTTALFGFTGSLHCAGMCSAMVGSCQNKTRQYFLARCLSYSILGLFAGFLGLGFFKNFLHISSYVLSIFVAIVCIIQIIFILKPSILNRPKRYFHVNKVTIKLLNYSPFSRSTTFGIITALLPCGFLYAALILSISYANPITSSASMFVFSIVTTPALLGGKTVFYLFSRKFYRFKKIIFSLLLLITAIFSLMRGGVFYTNDGLQNKIMCHPHDFN